MKVDIKYGSNGQYKIIVFDKTATKSNESILLYVDNPSSLLLYGYGKAIEPNLHIIRSVFHQHHGDKGSNIIAR